MEENKTLNEDLKEAVKDTLDRVRNQAMILGYRVACTTIMQMIAGWHVPGASKREYERIFKSVEAFCNKALNQGENVTESVTEVSNETVEE